MTLAALLALALFAQATPAQDAPVAPATPAAVTAEAPVPPGAPADDFGLTAWCYGSLGRWLELSPRALPEVRRIEGMFTRPGSSLEQDMATYTELQEASRQNMSLFATALSAAERASPRPLTAARDAAVVRGQSVWTGSDALPDRRLAQEWMSWTLPGRCETAAVRLRDRAELAAPALRGTEPAPVETTPAPAEAAPTESTPAPAEPAAPPA